MKIQMQSMVDGGCKTPVTTTSTDRQAGALPPALTVGNQETANLPKYLPLELYRRISQHLSAKDLSLLSSASKKLREELNPALLIIKQSKELRKTPRRDRPALHQRILDDIHLHADKLGYLIDAYWHLPRAAREIARNTIINKSEQLPDEKRREILAKLDLQVVHKPENIDLVDQFHDYIAQIAASEPQEQIGQFLAACRNITRLPPNHQSDAFNAILENTKDTSILRELASSVSYLAQANRSQGFYAVLAQVKTLTSDEDKAQILTELASSVSYLAQADQCEALDAVLTQVKTLSSEENKAQILRELTSRVRNLAEANRNQGFYAVLAQVKTLTFDAVKTEALRELASRVRYLAEANRNQGFYAVLALVKTLASDMDKAQILCKLASRVSYLVPTDRSQGFYALLAQVKTLTSDKDKDQILKNLLTHLGVDYLPEEDQDEALKAVRLLRHQVAFSMSLDKALSGAKRK